MKNLSSTSLAFFALLFLLYNCDQTPPDNLLPQQQQIQSSSIIDSTKAKELINYYRSSDTALPEFGLNFFYAGNVDSGRTITYQLQGEAFDTFWYHFKSVMDAVATQNQIQLRFHVAFRNDISSGTPESDPNFVPILEIVVDNPPNVQNEQLYLLEAVRGNHGRGFSEDLTPISDSLAKKMIHSWHNVAVENIHKSMYPVGNQVNEADTNRIIFYTFSKADTKDTYEYLNAIDAEDEKYFYLHLGIYYSSFSLPPPNMLDTIGLRTILQLDDTVLEDDKPGALPLFEFAYPCPKLCGKNKKEPLRK